LPLGSSGQEGELAKPAEKDCIVGSGPWQPEDISSVNSERLSCWIFVERLEQHILAYSRMRNDESLQ
jgi:hypothetical protein